MSSVVNVGFLATIVGVVFALGLAIAVGVYASRRSPRAFAFARTFGRPRVPDAGSPFIGRERELDTFRKLIVDPDAQAASARGGRKLRRRRRAAGAEASAVGAPRSLLLVTGAPGIGKRALLEQFERICATERAVARCGPVTSLREPQPVDEVLAPIAETLHNQNPNWFREFGTALDRYRRVARGRMTRGQEGLDAARDFAGALAGVVPGAQRGADALRSAAAEHAVHWWEGEADLAVVADAFVADLLRAADEDAVNRLVLLFADLDSRPSDRDVIWLRTALLPRITTSSVLVVASVAAADDPEAPGLAGLNRLGPQRMELEPFTEEEARRFVAEVIGLVDNPSLVDAIVGRSEGILDRLHGYNRYLKRFPAAQSSPTLPDDADAWASGGVTYSQMRELSSRFLEQVTVAASPLRWFNAALLTAVASAAKLEPSEEEPGDAADLVRSGTRPSWITARGGGWAIDNPERRRALAADFRRLDPRTYRDVHHAAAEYHRAHLAMLSEEEAQDGRVSTAEGLFKPIATRPELYDESDYVATLAELFYHLLGLSPERAFELVVRKAAEALFANPEAAEQMIPLDPELNLRPRQRLYLDLLARAAVALKDRQHAEAVRVLDQLKKAGDPVPLVKPVVLHLLGETYSNLDDDIDRATSLLEEADEALGHLRDDAEALRMRCWNATWLAYGLAQRDGVERAALAKLDEVGPLAKRLKDRSLAAELERVRALVHQQVGDRVAAKRALRLALQGFEEAGKPEDVASVRRDLASVFSDEGDYTRADRELEIAAGLYTFLADFKSRAEILVNRATLGFRRNEPASAQQHIDDARRLRPRDAFLENAIGNAFFAAGEYQSALECYVEALKYAPDVPFIMRNRAYALFYLWGYGGADEENRRSAEEILAGLLEKGRDAPTIQALVELKRLAGETEAADELLKELKMRRQRHVERHRDRAGAHWALGDLLQTWARDASGSDAAQLRREAEQAFAEARKLEPEEPEYAFRRAQSLRELNRIAEALEELWAALALAPNRRAIRQELADVIEEQPADDALGQLRRAFETLGRDAAFLETYGNVIGSLPNEEALDAVRLDAARFPDDAEFHYLLAKLLREDRQAPDRAPDAFEAISPVRFDVPGHHQIDAGGEYDLSLMRSREILAELERACELAQAEDSRHRRIEYLLELAHFRIEQRQWAEARQAARDARTLDPTDNRVDDVLRRTRYGRSWTRGTVDPVPYLTPVEVEVSADLLPWVEPPAAQHLYDEMFPALREELQARWGIGLPGVRVRPNESLSEATVHVHLNELLRYRFAMRPLWLAGAGPEELGAAADVAVATRRPWDGGAAAWVPEHALSDVPADVRVWDPRGVIVATVGTILDRHGGEFVTVREVARIANEQGLLASQEVDLAALASRVRHSIMNGRPVAELAAFTRSPAAATASADGEAGAAPATTETPVESVRT